MLGNIFFFEIPAGQTTIVLPDGYSYEKVIFTYLENTNFINSTNTNINVEFTYPVVNSTSPNYFIFSLKDPKKVTKIRGMITKLGQIPNSHYFDKEFEPILVTGDDGKEYNVIPSDQFK